MFDNTKILNPLQMNDWEFKKFICVVLSIQLAVWGSIGLDVIGLHLPILRQLISFVYLTFIPGLIILRILRLHQLGSSETLLYAIGLSIGTLMFTGFLINTFFPSLGIYEPFSLIPLIITLSIVVFILSILSYIFDKDFSNPHLINVSESFSPYTLFFCMLPFLCIFGTYSVNFYSNNFLLFLLILIISIIPILVSFGTVPKNLFPLAITFISLSLLYHRSLITMNLWGADMFGEFYYSKRVIQSFFWDQTIYENLNAMLSIVLLPPIYSLICDLSLVWVFKIIYPFIYSFVPLGLYLIFKRQFNEKISFLSVFYYMSIGEFYGVLPAIARQEVAELFLVLVILLVINDNMNKTKRASLFIVYGMLVILSHYAISYLFISSLLITWLILSVNNTLMISLKNKFHLNINSSVCGKIYADSFIRINSTVVLIFSVFALSWYMYVSGSSTFNTIVSIGDHIANTIFTSLLNPDDTEGLSMVLGETSSILYALLKYLYLVSQFFIAIGLFVVVLKLIFNKTYHIFAWGINAEFPFNTKNIVNVFLIFSCVYFGILVISLVIPHFSSSIGTLRLFHIALLLLAPFFVIGIICCSMIFRATFGNKWTIKDYNYSLKGAAIFLAMFLLLNSGLFHEIFKDDNPCSISLSTNEGYLSSHTACIEEIYGAEFLENKIENNPVYCDVFGRHILRGYIWPTDRIQTIKEDTETLNNNSYVYFEELNLKGRATVIPRKKLGVVEKPYEEMKIAMLPFYTVLIQRNKIYANGGSEIYR